MAVSLQQLEFFRAVARRLSFSAAAKDLYTSQPYVSNQIRKLEDHFAVPLFVRSSPRITLTEAGQALYDRVTGILDDVDGLDSVVRQFQGLQRGTIAVAATASPGNHVLPDLVARFHRGHPELVVTMRVGNTEDILRWLEVDEAEVGISPRRPSTGDLTAEPFYRERLVLIHPATLDVPDVSSESLAEMPKVVREPGSLTLAKMTELVGESNVVAQLWGTTAVNEAVAAGLGVSVVPERSARPWLEAGSVRALPLGEEYHDYFLLAPRERFITPAARAFIEYLRVS